MGSCQWSELNFSVILFVSETIMVILFGVFGEYGWDGTPVSLRGRLVEHSSDEQASLMLAPAFPAAVNAAAETRPMFPTAVNAAETKAGGENYPRVYTKRKVAIEHYYAMFQDVHVMIFIGFGFLMTFMRKFGYGGVGFNYIVAALVIQWSILLRGFFEMPENDYKIRLDITKMISGDFSAGTVLITLGVVLGKLSPVQYIVMIAIETALAMLNEWLVLTIYQASDVGGTITIHLFGAYFGLALARTIHLKEWSDADFNNLKSGSQVNDLFSMIGTLFLFMYWPSFNAALAVGDGRYRAVLNTYLAISSSCIGAYMVSWAVKEGKFSMDIIQNATLAGGVVVGAVCDMYLYPWGSMVCGFAAGIVSALGFHYLSPFLDTKWGIHDTCGVHNLHAMPALLGSFISAVVAGCATPQVYGSSYYVQFPALAPAAGTEEFLQLKKSYPDLDPGLGRSPTGQAANQLAALITTLGIAIIGGIVTGAFLTLPVWNPLGVGSAFDDNHSWVTPKRMASIDEGTLRQDLESRRSQKRHFPAISQNSIINLMPMRNLRQLSISGPPGATNNSFYMNEFNNSNASVTDITADNVAL